jgi:hypothetical protein
MKKVLSLIGLFMLIISFNTSTIAMPAPYVDAFVDYETFLNGVEYYLGDTHYFEPNEIDLHEDYYVSYQIKHYAYNRKSFNMGGNPMFIYQSKEKSNDYHFELYMKLKPGQETMTRLSTLNEGHYAVLFGEYNSYVQIRTINDTPLPESEIQRIFQLICVIYGKTWTVSS